MLSLQATIRQKLGRKTEALRKEGVLPAVLYGEDVESTPIEVSEKDFISVYKAAGESSLVSLELENKKYDVLIHQTAKDSLSSRFLHVDFYRPSTKKKVEAEIPLVFTGESPAVKDLGGILVREIQVLDVKGLAHNLPREIVVDVSALKTFNDRIYVKDLKVSEAVEILKNQDDIVVLIVPPKEEKEEVVPAPETKVEIEAETPEGKEEPRPAKHET